MDTCFIGKNTQTVNYECVLLLSLLTVSAVGIMDLGSVVSDWELQTRVAEVDLCSDNLIIRL